MGKRNLLFAVPVRGTRGRGGGLVEGT